MFYNFFIAFFSKKLGADKIKNAYEIIKILVHSVEQVTTVKNAGAAKKREVIRKLKDDYNIILDDAIVSDLIESAVLEMKNNITSVE